MVDSVSVRWVDLGTRLVLRHVVKVVGAEGRRQRNNNDADEQQDGEEGEGAEADDSGERAATIEVDLTEIRWAECTEGGQEPCQDEFQAKKLAGTESNVTKSSLMGPVTPPPSRTNRLYSVCRQHQR